MGDSSIKFLLGAVIAALIVVVIVIVVDDRYTTLNFIPTTFDAVVDVMAPLLLVGLFIERAVEVFINTGRGLGRRPIDEKIERIEGQISDLDSRRAELRNQLESVSGQALTRGQKNDLVSQIENLRIAIDQSKAGLSQTSVNSETIGLLQQRETYKTQTQRIAFVASVTAGLIVALAGIRAISPLVDVDLVFRGVGNEIPLILFHGVDVLLTAGLLGGGASGIHKVLSVFGDQLNSMRSK